MAGSGSRLPWVRRTGLHSAHSDSSLPEFIPSFQATNHHSLISCIVVSPHSHLKSKFDQNAKLNKINTRDRLSTLLNLWWCWGVFLKQMSLSVQTEVLQYFARTCEAGSKTAWKLVTNQCETSSCFHCSRGEKGRTNRMREDAGLL